MIPKIVERKITKMQKPGGLVQYLITLPKEYAESLDAQGIDSLLIAYNRGLGAFPKIPGFTEEALLTFLKEHPELVKLFAATEAGKTEDKNRPAEGPSK
jgi:hypothetical protein